MGLGHLYEGIQYFITFNTLNYDKMISLKKSLSLKGLHFEVNVQFRKVIKWSLRTKLIILLFNVCILTIWENAKVDLITIFL